MSSAENGEVAKRIVINENIELDDDWKCSVCENDILHEEQNCLVACAESTCGVIVHQICCGTQNTVMDNWVCKKCLAFKEQNIFVKCHICKQEEKDIEDVKYEDFIPCNTSGCQLYFHVTCARRKNLLCEERGRDCRIKFVVYCSVHILKLEPNNDNEMSEESQKSPSEDDEDVKYNSEDDSDYEPSKEPKRTYKKRKNIQKKNKTVNEKKITERKCSNVQNPLQPYIVCAYSYTKPAISLDSKVNKTVTTEKKLKRYKKTNIPISTKYQKIDSAMITENPIINQRVTTRSKYKLSKESKLEIPAKSQKINSEMIIKNPKTNQRGTLGSKSKLSNESKLEIPTKHQEMYSEITIKNPIPNQIVTTRNKHKLSNGPELEIPTKSQKIDNKVIVKNPIKNQRVTSRSKHKLSNESELEIPAKSQKINSEMMIEKPETKQTITSGSENEHLNKPELEIPTKHQEIDGKMMIEKPNAEQTVTSGSKKKQLNEPELEIPTKHQKIDGKMMIEKPNAEQTVTSGSKKKQLNEPELEIPTKHQKIDGKMMIEKPNAEQTVTSGSKKKQLNEPELGIPTKYRNIDTSNEFIVEKSIPYKTSIRTQVDYESNLSPIENTDTIINSSEPEYVLNRIPDRHDYETSSNATFGNNNLPENQMIENESVDSRMLDDYSSPNTTQKEVVKPKCFGGKKKVLQASIMCYICEEIKKLLMKTLVSEECVPCHVPGCKYGFHVTCGQNFGLLPKGTVDINNVKNLSSCKHHNTNSVNSNNIVAPNVSYQSKISSENRTVTPDFQLMTMPTTSSNTKKQAIECNENQTNINKKGNLPPNVIDMMLNLPSTLNSNMPEPSIMSPHSENPVVNNSCIPQAVPLNIINLDDPEIRNSTMIQKNQNYNLSKTVNEPDSPLINNRNAIKPSILESKLLDRFNSNIKKKKISVLSIPSSATGSKKELPTNVLFKSTDDVLESITNPPNSSEQTFVEDVHTSTQVVGKTNVLADQQRSYETNEELQQKRQRRSIASQPGADGKHRDSVSRWASLIDMITNNEPIENIFDYDWDEEDMFSDIEYGSFDVSLLLTCIQKLIWEIFTLYNEIGIYKKYRERLLAINARLSTSFLPRNRRNRTIASTTTASNNYSEAPGPSTTYSNLNPKQHTNIQPQHSDQNQPLPTAYEAFPNVIFLVQSDVNQDQSQGNSKQPYQDPDQNNSNLMVLPPQTTTTSVLKQFLQRKKN